MIESEPVLIIFFNRPDTLVKVLDQVNKVQPEKIYFFQDGPRESIQSDRENCQKCRDLVESYDWTGETHYNYNTQNMGCGIGPKTAIDWFFDNEDEGIILEDDCVPSISFFNYCSEMLYKYRNDNRVFLITGCNMELQSDIDSSYFFGYSGTNWGWATWKYNWIKMDYACNWVNNQDTFERMKVFLLKTFGKKGMKELQSFSDTNKRVFSGENISYWDVQWQSLRYLNHQLSIIPSVNLITNIGVGNTSTHAQLGKSQLHLNSKIGQINFFYNTRYEMSFPLVHPIDMVPNCVYDKKVDKKLSGNFFLKVIRKMRLVLHV